MKKFYQKGPRSKLFLRKKGFKIFGRSLTNLAIMCSHFSSFRAPNPSLVYSKATTMYIYFFCIFLFSWQLFFHSTKWVRYLCLHDTELLIFPYLPLRKEVLTYVSLQKVRKEKREIYTISKKYINISLFRKMNSQHNAFLIWNLEQFLETCEVHNAKIYLGIH